LGGTAQAGNAPEDWRGAVGGSSGDGPGNRHSEIRGSGPGGAPKVAPFDGISEEQLLGYGVPAEWLEDVREANEDTVLELADHLPAEAAEALLNLATGDTPPVRQLVAGNAGPFDPPDAQRRFRVMSNLEERERALDYPWEKWTSSSTRRRASWLSAATTGPPAFRGRRVPERQSWRFIARCSWPEPTYSYLSATIGSTRTARRAGR